MKKNGKLITLALFTFLMGSVPAFAREMTLQELGEEASKIQKDAGYVYIIGDYAFTSKFNIKTEDIMLASSTIKAENPTDPSKMVINQITRTYNDNYVATGWAKGTNALGTTALPEKFNIDYIDYKEIKTLYDVEPDIKNVVKTLGESAEDNGFKAITYENKTLTFEIAENGLEKKLNDYANNSDIIDLFRAFLNNNAKAVSAKVEGIEEPFDLKSDMSDYEVKAMAAVVLAKMADKNLTVEANISELKNMTYKDVAGKSIKITVVYDAATETEVEYTLAFTYDIKTEKDDAITSAVRDLQGTFKTHTNYGISGVDYDKSSETVTFKVSDISVSLKDFASDETGIVELFQTNLDGAVSFKLNGGEDTPIDDLDDIKIKGWAALVLTTMSGKSLGEANTLVLSDVVGKKASAEITYFDGTKVTYTIAFEKDFIAQKDEAIANAVQTFKAKASSFGFSNVAYEQKDHKLTFTIDSSNGGSNKKLVDVATDEVLALFKENLKGATSFQIEGVESEPTSIPSELTDEDIKGFAVQVFSSMLKDSVPSENPNQWTLDKVKGKNASATINFADGTSQKYTVEFN